MSYIEELANTPDVSLIDTDVDNLLARAIETYEAKYKELTGEEITLMPADKNRILLQTAVYLTMMSMIASDTEYQQGTLKAATGDALDAIGATRGSVERPQPQYAYVSVKYTFDGALTTAQTIPAGNRVACGDVYFATTEATQVAVGTSNITLSLKCTQSGTVGNGFLPNTITTHTDALAWVKSVTNTDTSQGGTDPDDDDYTRAIYNTPETYSIAGPEGAYIAQTKNFSDSIQDVCVKSPDDAISFEYKYDKTVDGVTTETTEEKSVNIANSTIDTASSNISDYEMDLSEGEITLEFTNPVKEITFNFTHGGIVQVYPLLENSEIPQTTFLNNLKTYLSADDKRPLTDKVVTLAPSQKNYTRVYTYYIDKKDANNAETIKTAVNKADAEYESWQKEKLGRDINPDELIRLVKEAGAKRLVITSPTYTTLQTHEIANCTSSTITYGGLE